MNSDLQVERGKAPVVIVILAAGASSRMGSPKQLLPVGGRTLLRRAAETALQSVCRPVLVVLGAHEEEMRGELAGLPVRLILNERWAEGMGSSIRAAMEALENFDMWRKAEAVVLMLCDQPFVTANVIDTLIFAYRESGSLIIASEYGGSLGVPALFSRRMFAELKALGGAEGAKHLIARHAGEVSRTPFARGAIDIDTPGEYARLQALPESANGNG